MNNYAWPICLLVAMHLHLRPSTAVKTKCQTEYFSSEYFIQHAFLSKCVFLFSRQNYFLKKLTILIKFLFYHQINWKKMQTLGESIDFFGIVFTISGFTSRVCEKKNGVRLIGSVRRQSRWMYVSGSQTCIDSNYTTTTTTARTRNCQTCSNSSVV